MKSSKKLSKGFKVNYLIITIVVILFFSIATASLARYKNRSVFNDVTVWDGSVATSFRKGSGTENDPYVISNGAELAYLSESLNYTDYANTYFILNNDILLNDGIFSYDKTNGLTYNKEGNINNITPYLNEYSNVNKFQTLNNFKGHLDGNSYTIYGLFITDNSTDNLSLFNNLEGTIDNLYVENSVIYGGINTAGIASSAKNTEIKNVIYNGYVVGNIEGKTEVIIKEVNDIEKTINNEEQEEKIDLPEIENKDKRIDSVKLKGKLEINSENEKVEIDGKEISNGDFEIDLGKSLNKEISIKYITSEETTYKITNISYEITYIEGNASGIITNTENVMLKNVINKASIYGKVNSSGLIGEVKGSLTIERSYNTGNIYSDTNATGIIDNIKNNDNDIYISQTYNSGDLNASNRYGLLNNVSNNTGSIKIINSFNTTDNYVIGEINNSVVDVENSITISTNQVKDGSINGEFNQVDKNNLKNYIKDNLEFKEFVDEENVNTNENNAWVFENTTLPIIYIDDINNPIATINVSKYSWNNIGYSLNTIKFNSSFAFKIEAVDNLRPIKSINYYISDKKTPLKKNEITSIDNWKEYSDVVNIKDEGFYTIYAKVVDYNDNISYLNTDLLVLDLSPSEVSIKLEDSKWTSLNTEYSNIYLDKATDILIEAKDELSGVDTIHYYISEDILSEDELNKLDKDKWNEYNDKISFNKEKLSIVYVKVVDKSGFITYASTDKIIIDGYKLDSIKVGRNSNVESPINITNKSSVSLSFKYKNSNNYKESYTHNLIINKLLPLNTKITLIDNINKAIYKYEIPDSEENFGYKDNKYATIPFALFEKIGKGSMEERFAEYDSTNTINEDYTIIIDFSNTILVNDISNIKISLALKENNKTIISTVQKTLKTFNVYSKSGENSSNSTLTVSANSINKFNLNSDSVNTLKINSKVVYKKVDDNTIYDTSIEDKNLGLAIKLVDTNNNIISKQYLKNILFKVNGKNYYPDNDNVIRINLDNGLKDTETNLSIETFANNTDLENGDYKFMIGVYSAYDGVYSKNIDYKVEVPVYVSDNYKKNNNYDFEVKISSKERIINKTESNTLNFNIIYKSDLNSPNIRVTLYKKDMFTAYNQNYLEVDLKDYVSKELKNANNNTYYVTENPISYNGEESTYNKFNLKLNTLKFQYGSYKFKFDLYDENKKIETIEKTVIVK